MWECLWVYLILSQVEVLKSLAVYRNSVKRIDVNYLKSTFNGYGNFFSFFLFLFVCLDVDIFGDIAWEWRSIGTGVHERGQQQKLGENCPTRMRLRFRCVCVCVKGPFIIRIFHSQCVDGLFFLLVFSFPFFILSQWTDLRKYNSANIKPNNIKKEYQTLLFASANFFASSLFCFNFGSVVVRLSVDGYCYCWWAKGKCA